MKYLLLLLQKVLSGPKEQLTNSACYTGVLLEVWKKLKYYD